MRKTKIICTLGPSTDDDQILRLLIQKGMNVARLNFSHGSHEEHKKRLERVKRIRAELDQPVALLLDTKGPEIRTGRFADGGCLLKPDTEIWIRQADILGNDQEFSISYKSLAQDIQVGDILLLDDGLIELCCVEIDGVDVKCVVHNGGPISDRKSVNIPGVKLDLPALTDKDIDDIRFGVENDFDFIAISFVRRASDITQVRSHLEQLGDSSMKLIAKIENQEGVDNFDSIIDVADGIMIARGDLGVEIPSQNVPVIQKRLIHSCYSKGKPCITATQMLDSMIRNPRPTRAEVSDVANAILDGTSAIMLSGETAAGKYPIEALEMMNEIAVTTEDSVDFWELFRTTKHESAPSVTNAVSHACCTTAMDLKAKAIVAVTLGGRTARLMSRFRPGCHIVAPTINEKNRRQLSLSWGVLPVLIDELTDTDALFEQGMQKAVDCGLVSNGDVVVISGGTPVGVSGMTNTLKVQTVGRLLCQGIGINRGKATGDVVIIENDEDLAALKNSGAHDSVLVVNDTDNAMLEVIKQAKAIVAETENKNCHAVTVGRLLDIPVVHACKNACKILRQGLPVTVDSDRGLIK